MKPRARSTGGSARNGPSCQLLVVREGSPAAFLERLPAILMQEDYALLLNPDPQSRRRLMSCHSPTGYHEAS